MLETQAPSPAGAAVELAARDVQHLVEVVGRGLRRAVRPEHGDDLLAVKPVARRQREQLHERLGLAQPPGTLRHELIVDRNGEGAEQMNAHSGRGSRGSVWVSAHLRSGAPYPAPA